MIRYTDILHPGFSFFFSFGKGWCVNVGSYEFSVLSVTLGVYLNCVTIPIYQEDMYNIVEQNVIRLYNAWLAWFTMVFIRFYIFVGATCFLWSRIWVPKHSGWPEPNPIPSIIWNIPSGWWFQTFFIFHFIYGIILPIDFHIFQDGYCTTNQPFHGPKMTIFFHPWHPPWLLGGIWPWRDAAVMRCISPIWPMPDAPGTAHAPISRGWLRLGTLKTPNNSPKEFNIVGMRGAYTLTHTTSIRNRVACPQSVLCNSQASTRKSDIEQYVTDLLLREQRSAWVMGERRHFAHWCDQGGRGG